MTHPRKPPEQRHQESAASRCKQDGPDRLLPRRGRQGVEGSSDGVRRPLGDEPVACAGDNAGNAHRIVHADVLSSARDHLARAALAAEPRLLALGEGEPSRMFFVCIGSEVVGVAAPLWV
jgi:hypothetical protein